ncbi:MAG: phenylalanine--tRNA ligase subunit beta [Ignavibacteriae bacterium]|nr:phenylalanine--tRNA ligase subunit beta [Ignavibacteriota bacterium]
MRISHQWLKELIDFKLTPEKLADEVSMLGLEIASYEDLSRKYEKFVVGEVLERAKHPNADRLTLCKVNVGKETLDIVCGAPNVDAGQKVAIALVGATIPHNQHDPDGRPFVLERAKIRGVESNGMICSAHELGIGSDADGILVLDGKAKVGTPLAKHLGQTDIVYEIEITANRGDWQSHFGVAREIGALLGKKMRKPAAKLRENKVTAASFAKVKILDTKKCPRYSARVLQNVKVAQSPQWLQDRLTAVGLRPINNVVDVTNYVMYETGQPLHAFDYEKIAGHAIVVRTAKDGEKFVTLDGKERTLRSDILMICDAEKPVGIGGVMGGANSEVSDSTTSILLESAYFDPASVRKTSKYLGLSTDASRRFERSTDIEGTVYALDRVSQLLQEMAGAEVLKGSIDIYPKKQKKTTINLRASRVNQILGTNLTKTQVKSYLERLELVCRAAATDALKVSVPSYRADLLEEIDLVEEVARMYGYNNIETKTRASIQFSTQTVVKSLQDELRSYCVGAGFNEILANSLLDAKTTEIAGEGAVKILNPVSVDMAYLRTSLIPGALHIVRRNQFQGQKQLRLFEIGDVFALANREKPNSFESYSQEERVLLLLAGQHSPVSYGVSTRPFDYLDVKGEVQALLSKFSLDKWSFISYDTHKALSEHNVTIEINGTYAGYFGKVKSSVSEKFEIEGDVYIAELNTAVLHAQRVNSTKYRQLPKFPKVVRDLAFIVDSRLPQEKVEKAIRESGGTMLETLRLFDVYTGQPLGSGQKSLAYALEFQPSDRTLTVKEIDGIITSIVAHVQRTCGATLRASS